jgi:hypothetical protein
MRALLAGTKDTVGYARMMVDRGEGRVILKPPRAITPDQHMATYLLFSSLRPRLRADDHCRGARSLGAHDPRAR